jgi:2-succinyl-5-enolpyruvyl-6-hydroxy-3-cyclohexene-1-carboxylate synthase
MTLDFRNTNTLWAGVLAETLAREGLQQVVLSPGSRSAPLVFAFAAHPGLEVITILDERSAAFFALGLARRTRRPVALVCTSGSAGAHYYPAVIEAHESGDPLLVLTADRPPELRDCAAGQTIDQQRLYGRFVSWFHEVAPPEARGERLRYLRQTARQAWRWTSRGPVHLNLPFRDPLVPVEDGSTAGLREGLDESFFNLPAVEVAESSPLRLAARTGRGLIVAGPARPEDPAAYSRHVLALAAASGWPVLADALSPLRHHDDGGGRVIGCYDAVLRDAGLAERLRPEEVLVLGAWPTSKVLRGWLEANQAKTWLIGNGPGSHDATHGRSREITAEVTAVAWAGVVTPDPVYGAAWAAAASRAAAVLAEPMGEGFEGDVTLALAEHLPEGAAVAVASSMPVRDFEYFWPVNDRRRRLFFSRGANGIDGTLSTALGVAHGGEEAVTLLTGDLAFLHDSNALLSAGRTRGALSVLVINNAGGGIFEHLPVAEFEPPFEACFITPQQVDLAGLCAAHGVEHHRLDGAAALAAWLSQRPTAGVRVGEVVTVRKADAARRKARLAAAARAAAGA